MLEFCNSGHWNWYLWEAVKNKVPFSQMNREVKKKYLQSISGEDGRT